MLAGNKKEKGYRKGGRLPKIVYFTVLPRVLALLIGYVFDAKISHTEKDCELKGSHFLTSKLICKLQ